MGASAALFLGRDQLTQRGLELVEEDGNRLVLAVGGTSSARVNIGIYPTDSVVFLSCNRGSMEARELTRFNRVLMVNLDKVRGSGLGAVVEESSEPAFCGLPDEVTDEQISYAILGLVDKIILAAKAQTHHASSHRPLLSSN